MKVKHDYTGKKVFVGIDVHKKTYSVAVVCDKVLVKKDTMPAEPRKLVQYLQKHFIGAKIKSAYEAGFSGFVLHRELLRGGIDSIVVHAASVEVGARDRVKTDKRDALKIAVQLEAERLEGIFVPSPEMEDRRELTRLRATLVKDKNRYALRLKHKAHYYGFVGPTDTIKVCKKWIEQIEKKTMAPGIKEAINYLVGLWKALAEKIKEVDKLLEKQALEDNEQEIIYRSVPGIGKTASRILANELGNMTQFSNERGLFSYTGLTPSEYSSGEHIRRGHISRQGKSILRSILVQSSWTAIRYDENLREIYERISRRSGPKRAIVAIARHLIGRIRACFRKNELYKQLPLKGEIKVA